MGDDLQSMESWNGRIRTCASCRRLCALLELRSNRCMVPICTVHHSGFFHGLMPPNQRPGCDTWPPIKIHLRSFARKCRKCSLIHSLALTLYHRCDRKKKELFLCFKMSKRLPVNLRNVSKAVSHSLSDLLPPQPVYVSQSQNCFFGLILH